jgi:hypothetical protein
VKLAIAVVAGALLVIVIGWWRVDATDLAVVGPLCDDDGIVVSYETVPAHPSHAVPAAVLRDIAPRCGGADVRVSLYQDGAEPVLVASGTATLPSEVTGPVTVPLEPAAPAERVDRIRLRIAGGSLPLPPECGDTRFATVLEVGDSAALLVGTPRRDLLFGRSGDETITGWAGDDCIVGGDGDDLLQGSEGDDVLLGGDGNDVLEGGNGNDVLIGGPGFDTFDGGPGRDVCVAEPGEPVRNCAVVTR